MADTPDQPEPTLASAIRYGRSWTGQSLRRLAKSSGVSPAQLSRLEAGQVEQPSITTLLALAPALNFHPTVLLILGGQLRGEQAREELRRLFDSAEEHFAREHGEEELPRLQAELEEAATDEQFRELAQYAFTLSATEVDWPAALTTVLPANAPDSDLLSQLISAWPQLTPDRRWRLVELVRDMKQASREDTDTHTNEHKEPGE